MPCAARQLEAIVGLAEAGTLEFDVAYVGDPDPTSAVEDALHEFQAGEILLCRDRSRRGHPLDLPHRLRRATGLPVDAPQIRRRSALRERRRRRAPFAGGHCVAEAQ